MDDIKWIKFYVSILSSRKIKRIRRMPDGNTIVLIWVYLLAQAGVSNSSGAVYFTDEIPYSPEEFALDFDFGVDTVKLAMRTFELLGMIEFYDGIIYIKNWEKYQNVDGLEKIREQTRLRTKQYRARLASKSVCDVTRDVTVTHGDAIDKEQDKELDKDITLNKSNNILGLFEKFYEAYPKKRKRADAEKAFKAIKGLNEETLSAMLKAIAEQKQSKEWIKEDGQYIPYPATWLRSQSWLDKMEVENGVTYGGFYDDE